MLRRAVPRKGRKVSSFGFSSRKERKVVIIKFVSLRSLRFFLSVFAWNKISYIEDTLSFNKKTICVN